MKQEIFDKLKQALNNNEKLEGGFIWHKPMH